eukprot:SAG11_NODE_2193_length_3702_cov_6.080242_8_plen_116_part_00
MTVGAPRGRKIGQPRGVGALAEARLRYGKNWETMSKEEKQLILYRFDKAYVRPTSTNGWVHGKNRDSPGSGSELVLPDPVDVFATEAAGGGDGGEPQAQLTDVETDVAANYFRAN